MKPYSQIYSYRTDHSFDKEIWQKLKQGEKGALQHIYDQNIKLLYSYGYKFCTDRELLEDCIQEVFMTLWERRSVVGDTDSIRPYLLTSLRRRIIRTVSRNHIQIDRNFEIDKYDFNIDFNPEKKLISSEDSKYLIEKINRELNQLTKKQQEVVYLKFHCGLSYSEIAEIMTIKYQSVRNLMHKTLRLLRNKFTNLTFMLSLLQLIK